ncbi:hypothetical protein MSG28_003941 [Choristoneura fumiferana]|uniref:Uncharacterized protein n=1 Tax=Choristoneura fumiferana TaxID=7141 RepID=A0ACC0KGQ3_CHOFU|nr:hypothetical protein MSG28_003941 [Choristoneura fumiferana]
MASSKDPFPSLVGCGMHGGDKRRKNAERFLSVPPPTSKLYKPNSLLMRGHPMKRGGIKERKSPFSVQLMNSGVHSSQTNPGFSRKPAGGAIFFY